MEVNEGPDLVTGLRSLGKIISSVDLNILKVCVLRDHRFHW